MVSTFVVKSCLWGLSKTAKKKLLPNTYYLCAIKYIVMKSFFNEHSNFLAPVYMRYFLNFRLISEKCYLDKVQIRSQNLKLFPLPCFVTKRVIFSFFLPPQNIWTLSDEHIHGKIGYFWKNFTPLAQACIGWGKPKAKEH